MLELVASIKCSPDLLRQSGRLDRALQAACQQSATTAKDVSVVAPDAKPRVGLLNIGIERGKGNGGCQEGDQSLRATRVHKSHKAYQAKRAISQVGQT